MHHNAPNGLARPLPASDRLDAYARASQWWLTSCQATQSSPWHAVRRLTPGGCVCVQGRGLFVALKESRAGLGCGCPVSLKKLAVQGRGPALLRLHQVVTKSGKQGHLTCLSARVLPAALGPGASSEPGWACAPGSWRLECKVARTNSKSTSARRQYLSLQQISTTSSRAARHSASTFIGVLGSLSCFRTCATALRQAHPHCPLGCGRLDSSCVHCFCTARDAACTARLLRSSQAA